MFEMRVRRSGRQGAAFLLAMVALVALLILGSSLIYSAVRNLNIADKDKKSNQALSLAESGVDMALVKLYEGYDDIEAILASTGTYSSSFTNSTGSCSYTVTAPYQGITNTVLVDSRSQTRTGRQSRVRVIANYLQDVGRVFRGAIFSDSPLTLNGAGSIFPDQDGEGGSLYASGDITFNGTSFTMPSSGEIYTTGTTNWVPDGVSPTHVFEHIASIPMPIIDLDWYRTHATTILSGNTTFRSSDLSGLSGIIYVNGDVRISGTYSGKAVIVATGSITVTGNVNAQNIETDALVLMSPRSVKISGTPRVDGLVYSHNVTGDAGVTASGNSEVYGAIVADVVTTNGGIDVHYRDVWKGLALPGTGKKQWAQVSWERLQ